jgi:hypothetical protein
MAPAGKITDESAERTAGCLHVARIGGLLTRPIHCLTFGFDLAILRDPLGRSFGGSH